MPGDALSRLLNSRWELYGFIRALVRNGADAEDVFQDVAAVIVRKEQQGVQIADFRAFSHEVVRMCVRSHFRERAARAQVPAPQMEALLAQVAIEGSFDSTERLAESEALWGCLQKLPEKSRRLVQLRFVADHGYDEIAAQLGSTAGAVRRAAARARLALVSCVERRLARHQEPA